MRQQKVITNKKKPVEIIDNRTKVVPKEMEDLPIESPEASKIPVRTIMYVEVGNGTIQQVASLVSRLNAEKASARGGKHYVVPVRNGKLTNDIFFENEFLKVVKELCEVQDGNITLKGGAQDVDVIRLHIE